MGHFRSCAILDPGRLGPRAKGFGRNGARALGTPPGRFDEHIAAVVRSLFDEFERHIPEWKLGVRESWYGGHGSGYRR